MTLKIESVKINQKFSIFSKISVISEVEIERQRLQEFSVSNIFRIFKFKWNVNSQKQKIWHFYIAKEFVLSVENLKSFTLKEAA